MLFDKIDYQQRGSDASPRTFLQASKALQAYQKKLPKISQNTSNIQNNSISNILSPKNGRQNSAQHAVERSFNFNEDLSYLRVPKVSSRNLPEVFHSSSQGGRRLK